MKNFIQFFRKSTPLTIGVILVLFSLGFLVQLVENGELFSADSNDIWGFIFFAMIGVPTLLFGVNKLAEAATDQNGEETPH